MFESKFSVEEKRNLVAKFNRRKVTAYKFCKYYNLTKSTFYQWRKNLAKENSFITLAVKAESVSDSEDNKTFISSPVRVSNSKVRLDFMSGCRLEELRVVVGLINATK